MPHQEHSSPTNPSPRFSPGRVLSAVSLVLLAAGAFAVIWFFPWPSQPKKPADTRVTPKRIQEMKRLAERQAEEEWAKRESRDKP